MSASVLVTESNVPNEVSPQSKALAAYPAGMVATVATREAIKRVKRLMPVVQCNDYACHLSSVKTAS